MRPRASGRGGPWRLALAAWRAGRARPLAQARASPSPRPLVEARRLYNQGRYEAAIARPSRRPSVAQFRDPGAARAGPGPARAVSPDGRAGRPARTRGRAARRRRLAARRRATASSSSSASGRRSTSTASFRAAAEVLPSALDQRVGARARRARPVARLVGDRARARRAGAAGGRPAGASTTASWRRWSRNCGGMPGRRARRTGWRRRCGAGRPRARVGRGAGRLGARAADARPRRGAAPRSRSARARRRSSRTARGAGRRRRRTPIRRRRRCSPSGSSSRRSGGERR